MNSLLISIIIPTDHSAQYLETALKSVNEQTFENLELIFIDNHPGIYWNDEIFMHTYPRKISFNGPGDPKRIKYS